jgi:hypothetical protein
MDVSGHERRAPRSAGLAGIVFSLLFIGAVIIAGDRPPDGLTAAELVTWFDQEARAPVTFAALYLLPFAGIAFLWFIGVIRDRIGVREDRFLSTVFLGSGLLFVAMMWASAAALGSPVADNRYAAAPPLDATTLETFRSATFSFLFVLASRAAGVFMIVTSTIALRTSTLPTWLVGTGYVVALVMLLSLSLLQWILLLFPAWVFVVSLYVLSSEIRAYRMPTPRPPGASLE